MCDSVTWCVVSHIMYRDKTGDRCIVSAHGKLREIREKHKKNNNLLGVGKQVRTVLSLDK